MVTTSMNEGWLLYDKAHPNTRYTNVTLPASVYEVLAREEVIDAPALAGGKDVAWVADREWVFENTFSFSPAEGGTTNALFLCFARIDTIADVYVNDRLVLRADSYFLPQTLDVTLFAKKGENSVRIDIASATAYAEERVSTRTGTWKEHAVIRKPAYHFGSTYSPRLPAGALFEVSLCVTNSVMFLGENIATTLTSDCRTGKVHAQFSFEGIAKTRMTMAITLEREGVVIHTTRKVFTTRTGHFVRSYTHRVEQPKLWQPNTLGAAERYTLSFTLLDEKQDRIFLTKRYTVGFKHVTLTTPSFDGKRLFVFEVNGRRVFMRGCIWSPLDAIPARVTRDAYVHALDAIKEANVTLLRVRGDGEYERDEFYELCTERGILVWQDFMFANARYDDDDKDFMGVVEKEATYHITRIRKHPCLLVFNGIHERKDERNEIFDKLLPALVKRHAEGIPYVPSSPYGATRTRNRENEGTQHLLTTWETCAPLNEWERAYTFVAEFGLQAFPSERTLREVVSEDAFHIDSDEMITRNTHGGWEGMNRLIRYTTEEMAIPRDMGEWIYKSQVAQAEGVAKGIAHFRKNKPHQWGAIVTQANDAWQGITWSAIDYRGRRKALYYAIKRAYRPIRVVLTKNEYTGVHVAIVNDTNAYLDGTLELSLFDTTGGHVKTITKETRVIENDVTDMGDFLLDSDLPIPPERKYYVARLRKPENITEWEFLFFSPLITREMPAPHITREVAAVRDGVYHVRIESDAIAYAIRIRLSWYQDAYYLSDNYMTLFPHQTKDVLLYCSSDPGATRIAEALTIDTLTR